MTTVIEGNEWLETDGLGGFASGTAAGIRTRRYHALLLTATTPPTGRVVLVNGVDAWVDTAAGSWALSSQRYDPGVVHPDGASRIAAFTTDPWPRWTYSLPDGTTAYTRNGEFHLSRDGEVVTPPLSAGCLAGVTRELVLEWTGAREEDLPLSALAAADEVFLTSSTRDIQPVAEVDGVGLEAPPGPLTRRAVELFAERSAQNVDP